jgi:hypothetical protein
MKYLAAGGLAGRGADLPGRAERAHDKLSGRGLRGPSGSCHAGSGRQGCRPPRQARMPDATWLRRAPLPAVVPGSPAQRKEPPAKPSGLELIGRSGKSHAGSGRQGCRPPRQARMPDATWLRRAPLPAVVPGSPARRKEPPAKPSGWESLGRLGRSHAGSGRQGCRPLRQAGMPDATRRQ